MNLLQEVDIALPPLPSFDDEAEEGGEDDGEDYEGDEEDEDEGNEGDEEVVEIEANGKMKKKRRENNYTGIEDATLCRAWAAVGMDVVFDTDQTGKRYWQHIKDKFHKNHTFTTQTNLDI
jgi:hypothetical protein